MSHSVYSVNPTPQQTPTPSTEQTTGQRVTWRPILEGELRDRALESVRAISQALSKDRQASWQPAAALEPNHVAFQASLADGLAGISLFFAYLAQTSGQEADETLSIEMIEQAMELVATYPMEASLFEGFTGIGWTLAHLSGRIFEPGDDDAYVELDETLLGYASQSPWTAAYDLIGGLVGMGVYALERLPNPTAIEILEQIVHRLDELSESTPQGITWLTSPLLLPEWQRELSPAGHYDLGLAHGIPGIIALLGRIYQAGIAPVATLRLLMGSVAWLLAQEGIGEDGKGFASWLAPGQKPSAARLAWCYGEPGIAAALLLAARCVGEAAWEQAALEIARHAASRPVEEAGVNDAAFCHGAAGLGHLFNRMYQSSGDAALGDAARFWLERALNFRRPGQGIAGFSAWEPDDERETPWVDYPGLLMGAAGIGLALLAATTPIEPAWDRMMLVDIPLESPTPVE